MALVTVDDALAQVLRRANALPVEDVPLSEAAGRVLARDLAAKRTQPPADVSAMDGYAVRAADVVLVPTRLTLVAEVAAGRPFDQGIGPGEAARIFTGGVVPDGADTIVIQENAKPEPGAVVIETSAAKGRHIRRAGLDFRTGDVLLAGGYPLTPIEIGLAAALNYPALPVHRRPKLALLATGDELVPPGSEPGPGQIIFSNGFALEALFRAEGADVINLGVVPDRLGSTIAAIRQAKDAQADVLVTTGGASVGDYDLVQDALRAEAMDMAFWKVAMRPGKPLMNGMLGPMHVLGLPGNPVSSIVCALLFVAPLIRKLLGRRDLLPRVESAMLGRDLPKNDERQDYLRARLVLTGDDKRVATPFADQDSSMLALMAKADCLVIREPYAEPAQQGDTVPMIRLRF